MHLFILISTKKTLCSYFKRKQEFFVKQIQRFVDSEFVKTRHDQVIFYKLVDGFGEQDTTKVSFTNHCTSK